jgi:hypothetical protein
MEQGNFYGRDWCVRIKAFLAGRKITRSESYVGGAKTTLVTI